MNILPELLSTTVFTWSYCAARNVAVHDSFYVILLCFQECCCPQQFLRDLIVLQECCWTTDICRHSTSTGRAGRAGRQTSTSKQASDCILLLCIDMSCLLIVQVMPCRIFLAIRPLPGTLARRKIGKNAHKCWIMYLLLSRLHQGTLLSIYVTVLVTNVPIIATANCCEINPRVSHVVCFIS